MKKLNLSELKVKSKSGKTKTRKRRKRQKPRKFFSELSSSEFSISSIGPKSKSRERKSWQKFSEVSDISDISEILSWSFAVFYICFWFYIKQNFFWCEIFMMQLTLSRLWRGLWTMSKIESLARLRPNGLLGFILVVSSSDSLLVVSTSDIVQDCHFRPFHQSWRGY